MILRWTVRRTLGLLLFGLVMFSPSSVSAGGSTKFGAWQLSI